MAKGSGTTRSGMPNRNPQFTGVSNKAQQMSHDSIWDTEEDGIRKVMALTGVKDRQIALEMFEAVNFYTNDASDEMRYVNTHTKQEYYDSDYYNPGHKFSKEASDNEYDNLRKYYDKLEKLIDQSPKWAGGTTYRSILLNKSKISKFKVGDEIGQGGIASWTTDKNFALSWRGKSKNVAIFVCDKPQNGTSARFGCYHDGKEVITSEKARWKVTEIEPTSNVTYIHVEPTYNKKGASY